MSNAMSKRPPTTEPATIPAISPTESPESALLAGAGAGVEAWTGNGFGPEIRLIVVSVGVASGTVGTRTSVPATLAKLALYATIVGGVVCHTHSTE